MIPLYSLYLQNSKWRATPHTLNFFSYAHNAFTSPITPSFGLKYILNDDDGWRLLWGEGVGGRQIDADDSSLRVFIGVGVIERFFYISPLPSSQNR